MAKKLSHVELDIKKLIQKNNLHLKKEIKKIVLKVGTPTFRQENGLISKKEVLIYFDISDSTLKKWREYHDFPEGHPDGREVCFKLAEVRKFKRP